MNIEGQKYYSEEDSSFNIENKDKENNGEQWKLKDFKGFIHFHSWEGSSCGREKISDIVQAIKTKTGLNYIGFAEHVGWPGEEYWSEKIEQEFESINKIQIENPEIKIFKGVEVNILKSGTIDGIDLIDRADIVVASHHYLNIEPQSESTADATKDRWINVMENYPQVNVLGHPLRDLPESEWDKIDWNAICEKANQKNVIIEIGISDFAVDHLPENFLHALSKNNNKVVFAPDFHHLVNPDINLNNAHYLKKDNWFGHRVKDLTEEQKEILKRYYELKGKIAGKNFNEENPEIGKYVLKGRKVDEKPLNREETNILLEELNKEKAELRVLESSEALKDIYDILLASEKIELPNGKTKEKYPLSVATLIRFGRRMDRVRRAGIKAENLVNLWDKQKLINWLDNRK